MKKKHMIIGGIAVVGVLAALLLKDKLFPKKTLPQSTPDTLPQSTPDTATVDPNDKGFPIALADNSHAWIVLNGKKFGLVSEKAFGAYGYSTPRVVTVAEAAAYPDGGWIAEDGKVMYNA